jgi:hypothetical protein
MTPLDDELRSLLHTRADQIAPASDPLSGIERRAKRMRRNQVAASVAGAALAVAAVAIAVPALVPDHDRTTGITPATSGPSPSSSAAVGRAYGPNELDPVHPWTYRGDKAVLASGNFATLVRDWLTRHPASVVNAIFGQVYEPSNRPEIVFVSHSSGEDRWGVATPSESGSEFLVDEPLPVPSTALMAVLPGDEAPRLLILAGPATGDLSYAKDGATFRTVVGSDPGVAYVPLEGDTSHDMVRVLDGNGDQDHPVFLGAAPDATPTSTATPAADQKPANYLEWQTRGIVDARTEDQAVTAFAQAKGTTPDRVGHHVFWGGTDKGGRDLVFMEAWVASGEAQTFGFVSTGEPFLGPVIGKNVDVLAYLASGAPGAGSDVLVILPRLGAGPFSYASSSSAPYREVGNARSDMANFAVIDRDPKASSDKLKVLDGDGMKVLYDGPVQPLLCGASGCG